MLQEQRRVQPDKRNQGSQLKEHRTAGVTLSMKNCFGITPCTIYSDQVPEDEPAIVPVGFRGPMHSGSRTPPKARRSP